MKWGKTLISITRKNTQEPHQAKLHGVPDVAYQTRFVSALAINNSLLHTTIRIVEWVCGCSDDVCVMVRV